MNEHISSSLYTPEMKKLSVDRLKAFIKGVIVAEAKIKERNKAREELKENISKVKKLAAAKKPAVDKLKKQVSQIEDKVNTVLQKEAKLLRTSAYEGKTIAELRKRIAQLEEELTVKNTENKNLSKINEDSLTRLNSAIDSLQQKIGSYIKDKTERERKMKELEEKIRNKTDIGNVKEKISMLERKYAELEQKGEHSEEDLVNIRRRIDSLKLEM